MMDANISVKLRPLTSGGLASVVATSLSKIPAYNPIQVRSRG